MKKIVTKKNLLILGAVVILFVGFMIYQWSVSQERIDQQVFKRLGDNKEWLMLYDELKVTLNKSRVAKNNDLDALMSLGMAWKKLGSLTEDDYFNRKALEVYQLGIAKFGDQNVVFYWNAGSLASSIGDYALAEKYFKKALAIAPAYYEGYAYLAELYRYKMNNSPEEIIRVYTDGFTKTAGNLQLLLDKSSYLRALGRYQEALQGYKILSQQYPNNQGFKQVIQELEEKLK